jgi:hypothetical protein
VARIASFAHNTKQFHPHCIAEMLTATDHGDAEPHLDRIAAVRGIARRDVETNESPLPPFSTDLAIRGERHAHPALPPAVGREYTPRAERQHERRRRVAARQA